jgi:CspA family cold shock protein
LGKANHAISRSSAFLLAGRADRASNPVFIFKGNRRAERTVKSFNIERGFGFIVPDDGGNDVFVHVTVVEKAGYSGLVEGVKVTFDIVDNRGKQAADNLRVR